MIQVIEDAEREHLKDKIYLIEKRMEEEREFWEWWEHVNKLPAKIEIINKIPEENVKTNIDTLPF